MIIKVENILRHYYDYNWIDESEKTISPKLHVAIYPTLWRSTVRSIAFHKFLDVVSFLAVIQLLNTPVDNRFWAGLRPLFLGKFHFTFIFSVGPRYDPPYGSRIIPL